ncbi:DUF5107 domain-containing protein [Streptomyces armeniacus]|uniref:DUF5107 domain-containing protein n=1 Tax=Streptomyces armeniacus TaxID=83291 RepID=UPI001AD82EC8|nr:DUF5107 domain-containing protein [Streptomyces armeniacus]
MNTSLRVSTVRLPAAAIGTEGHLPLLGPPDPPADLPATAASLAAEAAYGRPRTLLPYGPQNGHARTARRRGLPVVVLENDVLTATFVPSLGGRLWSLVHRPAERELLHRPAVLRPVNMALRGAWVPGGVEWNFGVSGARWPLTCAPLHAVRLALRDGTPVLRMYEFERLRRVLLVIDAWLPEGSPVLLVRIAIRNPGPDTVPVSWWSATAVPERPDVRVLAPADHAFRHDRGGRLRRAPFAPPGGAADRSYPGRQRAAGEHFFDIGRDQRPWTAALDGTGRGLVQLSTGRLRGRKLFHWGADAGTDAATGADARTEAGGGTGARAGTEAGRRTEADAGTSRTSRTEACADLSDGGDGRWLELQAGLTRAQSEHAPLPPYTEWMWAEAYGPLAVQPALVHGDWGVARRAAARAAERLVPPAVLDEAAGVRPVTAGGHPYGARGGRGRAARHGGPRVLSTGSGWGALETAAEFLPPLPGLPFGSVQREQRPWLKLLTSGRLPVQDPPARPVTGRVWRTLLERHPCDWHARYHLGLVRHADGDTDGARRAWQQSVDAGRNPWSLRCLAVLAARTGDAGGAAVLLTEAHRLRPALTELTVETLRALLDAHRPDEALDLLPADVVHDRNADPRLRLLAAEAALLTGGRTPARILPEDGIFLRSGGAG